MTNEHEESGHQTDARRSGRAPQPKKVIEPVETKPKAARRKSSGLPKASPAAKKAKIEPVPAVHWIGCDSCNKWRIITDAQEKSFKKLKAVTCGHIGLSCDVEDDEKRFSTPEAVEKRLAELSALPSPPAKAAPVAVPKPLVPTPLPGLSGVPHYNPVKPVAPAVPSMPTLPKAYSGNIALPPPTFSMPLKTGTPLHAAAPAPSFSMAPKPASPSHSGAPVSSWSAPKPAVSPLSTSLPAKPVSPLHAAAPASFSMAPKPASPSHSAAPVSSWSAPKPALSPLSTSLPAKPVSPLHAAAPASFSWGAPKPPVSPQGAPLPTKPVSPLLNPAKPASPSNAAGAKSPSGSHPSW